MNSSRFKHKINAGLYRKRSLNLTIIRLQNRINELNMCLNGKNHSKIRKNCEKSTKIKKC